jgi:translation initiation factor 3 subunit F
MSLDAASSALHLNLPASTASQSYVPPCSSPVHDILTFPSRPPSQITVHPSVLAQILTHHQRRPQNEESTDTTPRVIGTLMGLRSENGLEIEVRSCFAVPHSEDEEKIALDMPFHQSMVDLLAKNGAKEVIVGW